MSAVSVATVVSFHHATEACIERRTYADPHVAEIAHQMTGARKLDSSTLIIQFESLAARAQFWRDLAIHEEWQRLCQHHDASYQFSIIRGASA